MKAVKKLQKSSLFCSRQGAVEEGTEIQFVVESLVYYELVEAFGFATRAQARAEKAKIEGLVEVYKLDPTEVQARRASLLAKVKRLAKAKGLDRF